MNSFTKKIISIMLVVLLVITAAPTAYAFEEPEAGYSPSEEDTVNTTDDLIITEDTEPSVEDTTTEEEPETEPEAGASGEQNENEIVALLSVVTRVKGIGHAWIYIENVSDRNLQVGHYSLPPNEGVSVGLFSFTCADGIGIYYNVEAYCCNVHGGDGLVSITTDLDMNEMEKLSKNLRNYLNHWDPFFNCMYFAFSMWNSVSGKKLVPLVIPALGQMQLRIHGGKADNLKMFCPPPERVYRLRGRGSNAKLVPVSAASIDQTIGG